MKKNQKVSKPRNHVTLTMIRSNKTSEAHQKNHREELLEEIMDEEFDELYSEWENY